jgi:probable HAF family extracellular repeat protein
MKNEKVALWVLCLGSLLCCSAVFGEYQFIDLGVLPGGTGSSALSINNNGQIVGWTFVVDQRRVTLFDSTGSGNNIDLQAFKGGTNRAAGINDNGYIIGTAQVIPNGMYPHAMLFDSTGAGNNLDLGIIHIAPGNRSSQTYSSATAINNNNQIVGFGYRTNDVIHAALFDFSGSGHNIDLGTLGGTESEALAINNHGSIVGYAYNSSGKTRATLFDSTGSGNNIDLGYGTANSINDNNQIAGFNGSHAVLFDITGSGHVVDLGALSAYQCYSSYANSINNKGQIVGYSSGSKPIATLFDSTGAGNNINLNTYLPSGSGWFLSNAIDINDNGWIIGQGTSPSGQLHAYLLKPIPEPGSVMLLLAGAGLFRLRRKA